MMVVVVMMIMVLGRAMVLDPTVRVPLSLHAAGIPLQDRSRQHEVGQRGR
jgi:hypothetical protein